MTALGTSKWWKTAVLKIISIYFVKVSCHLQFLKNTKYVRIVLTSNSWLIRYYQQIYEDFAMERRFAI